MRLFAGIFNHCERRSKSTFEVEQVWKKSFFHSEIKLRIWCYKSASLTTNGSTNEALESDIEREKRSREEALPTKLLSYPLRLAQGGSIKSLDERGVIRRRPLYIPLNKKGAFLWKGTSFVLEHSVEENTLIILKHCVVISFAALFISGR